MCRCRVFKQTARIIPEGATNFNPMSSHSILYVGHNLALLAHLRGELGDYRVIRCPVGSQARTLIAAINYSLLLFDEELPDATGSELAEFSCSLARSPCTPFIIVKNPCDFESLARAVMEVCAA
jgi:DNA-binding response OmpR family regulator